MKTCKTCGNTEWTKAGLCSYCVWKGTVGPGKQLREIAKQSRRKKDEDQTEVRRV